MLVLCLADLWMTKKETCLYAVGEEIAKTTTTKITLDEEHLNIRVRTSWDGAHILVF